jgi:hypothetical protein
LSDSPTYQRLDSPSTQFRAISKLSALQSGESFSNNCVPYREMTLDAISRTQTEIKLVYFGHFLALFGFLFMIHSMNRPQRSVSKWFLVGFALATVYAITAGYLLRKRLFKQSVEALPGNVRKAVGLWRGAHFIGFSYAMSIAIFGVALRFLGSSWYVAGTFFCLSLGFLLLWRPRQLAVSDVQPA